jgi:L-seryl-tRNA(Ser) seleniumtransferase
MDDHPNRRLPAVHQVLQDPAVAALVARHGHDAVADAVRGALADARGGAEFLPADLAGRLAQSESPRLRPVINATGVILHTNLGRAPLAEAAARAAYEAARGALNLELDLQTGGRSQRQDAVRGWLTRLLGCESATAVNNCAAATVLVLRALAAGREVIVSRGQLVEIGGSFRIPEILAASGATLREVGTTNITRVADYQRAITPSTALLMRIHPSNYRIRGFSEMPGIADLVPLGRKFHLPVIDDIGSGAVVDFARFGLPGEPLAAESLRAGADLVLFSGDKLLGGPQAGIIAGRRELIEVIEHDPLMRALRLDKMTLAALEATLHLYLRPDVALAEVPVLRQLHTPTDVLRDRANRLAARLTGAAVRDDVTYVGGGSLPDQPVPTVVVALRPTDGDEAFARRLRQGDPAVVARIQNGEVLFDLRSVAPDQIDALAAAAQQALRL